MEWKRKEVYLAKAGVAGRGVGTFFTVRATENIVSALGVSGKVGALFDKDHLAALAEAFATWSVARSGPITFGAPVRPETKPLL